MENSSVRSDPMLIFPSGNRPSEPFVNTKLCKLKNNTLATLFLSLFWLRKKLCFLDINECLLGFCHVDATCTNTQGSFECTCNPGHTGNGRTICVGK